MFILAFAIGIFSYLLFLLGILGWLYEAPIVIVTVFFWGGFVLLQKEKLVIPHLMRNPRTYLYRFLVKPGMTMKMIASLFLLQILINLIGVFGPEIGFDALWYHLTISKLFLQWHQVRHIPGGLLYYADMPKLVDMLYIPGIVFLQETGAKLIHFSFGILCCIALYKMGRKFFSPLLSLLAVIIFYTNLVVGWESISAYIDLGWTFFQVMAVWAFFQWVEKAKVRWVYVSAVMTGFAVAAKIVAIPSIVLFVVLIFLYGKKEKMQFTSLFKIVSLYIGIALLSVFPWLVFTYLHTGNPFYPLFDPILKNAGYSGLQLLNPLYFLITFWTLFTHAADPISPWYLMLLPLVVWFYKKAAFSMQLLYWYSGLALLLWYFTSNTGGGRFLVPYLPALSLVSIYPLTKLKKKYASYFIVVICVIAGISICYRGVANAKFVPVLIGKETKAQFLAKHLNFSYGDWYDIDGVMAKTIKLTDRVLLYGYHNLYYVNFPYIHDTWVKKGDRFNYIATDGSALPTRFAQFTLVYQNTTTHIHLYSDGGSIWTY